MSQTTTVRLTVELTEGSAEALAQMCKRFGRYHAEQLSNSLDGDREGDAMILGVFYLRRALAEAGFAPR